MTTMKEIALVDIIRNVTEIDFSAYQDTTIYEEDRDFDFAAFDAFNNIIDALKKTVFADLLFVRVYDKYDFSVKEFERVSVDSDGNLFVIACGGREHDVTVSDYYDYDSVDIALVWDIDTVKGSTLQDDALGFTYEQYSEARREEKAERAARITAAGSYLYI